MEKRPPPRWKRVKQGDFLEIIFAPSQSDPHVSGWSSDVTPVQHSSASGSNQSLHASLNRQRIRLRRSSCDRNSASSSRRDCAVVSLPNETGKSSATARAVGRSILNGESAR